MNQIRGILGKDAWFRRQCQWPLLQMQSKPQALIPSLSWRSAVPSIKRALVRFAFVGMTPIVAFYLVYRMLGPIEGMIAGTATATVALGIQAIRMRRFDPVGWSQLAPC